MSSMQKIFRKLIGPVHEIGWRAFMPRRDGSALMAAYWHEYAKTWIFRGLLGSVAGVTLTRMLANAYFAANPYLQVKTCSANPREVK